MRSGGRSACRLADFQAPHSCCLLRWHVAMVSAEAAACRTFVSTRGARFQSHFVFFAFRPLIPFSLLIDFAQFLNDCSLSPTVSPTSRPTVRGDPFLLKGVTFYDRNANGERDSNVVVMDMGQDVEYSHGLGGVAITLVQCDPETNEELIDKENNSYASAMTQGFDVTGTPMLTNIEGAGR